MFLCAGGIPEINAIYNNPVQWITGFAKDIKVPETEVQATGGMFR